MPLRWTAKEEGADDSVQSGPLPVVRHRAAGAGGQGRAAADGAGHVERLGHPHALRPASGVQSIQLPDRIGLAARQCRHRIRVQALRLRRRSGKDSSRYQRRGKPLLVNQLPELYTTIDRNEKSFPVQYLGANVPQAWAAGSVFTLMQAIWATGRTRRVESCTSTRRCRRGCPT